MTVTYKNPFIWVLHGPNGEREEFLGSRDHAPKAAKEFFDKLLDVEKDQWTIESRKK